MYISEIPSNIKLIDIYINNSTPIKHKCLKCEYIWKIRPKDIIKGQGCPNCYGNVNKTTAQYAKDLPANLNVLEKYINNHTKILHKCSCDYTWSVKPNTILNGSGCPRCANHGFTPNLPAILYIIEFPSLGSLYKVGITNDYKRRMSEFGYKSKAIFIIEFKDGREAWDLEKEYLNILKHYMFNTGLLRSGNTETFRI